MANVLREVEGEPTEGRPINEQSPRLDGKTVTNEDLEQQKQNKSTRIIETNPGEYKTLTRLQG